MLPPMENNSKTLGQILDVDIADQTAGLVLTSLGSNLGYDLKVAGSVVGSNKIEQLNSSVIVTDTGTGEIVVDADGTDIAKFTVADGLDLLTSKLAIAGAKGSAGNILTSNGTTVSWAAPAGGATAITNDVALMGIHTSEASVTPAYALANMFIDAFADDSGIATFNTTKWNAGGFITTTASYGTPVAFKPLLEPVINGQSITVGADAGGVADQRFTSSASGSGFFLLDKDAANQTGRFTVIATVITKGGGGGPNCFQGWTKNTPFSSPWNGNSKTAYVQGFGASSAVGWKAKSVYDTVGDENVITGYLDTGSGWVLSTTTYNADFKTTVLTDLYYYQAAYKDSGADWVIDLDCEIEAATPSATGNFISDQQTALAAVTKVGIVVVYKNAYGTATLNTDLIAEVSADGGSNYSTVTLVASGTYSTGILQAIANDVTVTSGTTIQYRISFANQSTGVKETQVYGASLMY